jgi:hypothetical protein
MANLDTQDKRSSGVDVSLPWRGKFPVPTDDPAPLANRQHVADMYSGILASGGAAAGTIQMLSLMGVGT